MSDNGIIVGKVEMPEFKCWQGKIRDIFELDRVLGFLAVVATDRISAFDRVLPTLIPGKGVVLTQVSNLWMPLCEPIIPNDVIGWDHKSVLPYLNLERQRTLTPVLEGRTVVVRKADVLPMEAVVRGYIDGSYWEEYLKVRGEKSVSYDVAVYGHQLPGNLVRAQELPMPIFTPSTKAEKGQHDQNLSEEELTGLFQKWLATSQERRRQINAKLLCQLVKATSLAVYTFARDYARKRDIIIADTKFEFGLSDDGQLILIDELLTPDSSRFWPMNTYQPGKSQPSLDKQPVRDWLTANWGKELLPPALPDDVIRATTEQYRRIQLMLTNKA